MTQLGIGGGDANFIVEKAKGQHFQVACGKYFEAKHKGSTLIETELGGITHPNQFFEESMKFYTPKDEQGAAAAPAGVTPAKRKAEGDAGAGIEQFGDEAAPKPMEVA
jgi:DNA primase large subunit